MSPTQDYLHGRTAEALASWREQLAAGRSWSEVEDEIVRCCEGRVDLLTRLLLEAETLRGPAETAPHRGSRACTPRHGVPHPRQHHWSGPEPVSTAAGTGFWS